MPLLAIRPVSRHGRSRVITGRLLVTDQIKKQGRCGILTIVVVTVLQIGRAITVRNRAQANVTTEKCGTLLDTFLQALHLNLAFPG